MEKLIAEKKKKEEKQMKAKEEKEQRKHFLGARKFVCKKVGGVLHLCFHTVLCANQC